MSQTLASKMDKWFWRVLIVFDAATLVGILVLIVALARGFEMPWFLVAWFVASAAFRQAKLLGQTLREANR